MSARMASRRVGLAALIGLSGACNSNKPEAAPSPLARAATRPAAPPAAAPSTAAPAPTPPPPVARPPVDEIAVALPPRKEVPWSSPRGKVGKAEQAVAGTWVAAVGDYASRTAYMAARMHAEPGPGGTWPSMQRDNQRKTNCVWLELTNDHRGERHECVMNEGKPGIASMIDPLSGQKLTDEVTFEWRFDPATRTLHVRYDKDVYLPALDDKGGTRLLRFRQWDATLGEKVGNGEAVQEYLPEHDYKVPVRYVFEIFSGHFVEGMDPAGAKK